MSRPVNIHHGDGAKMNSIADGEADLVFTSPPYWPDEMVDVLARASKAQTDVSAVQTALIAFARSLRPVFAEAARVLGNGRAFILQSKDIRYGGFLIPLSDVHISMANTCGLMLVSRINWIPGRRAHWRTPAFVRSPRVGSFRTLDGEQFVVLSGINGIERRKSLKINSKQASSLVSPLWSQLSPPRKGDLRWSWLTGQVSSTVKV